MQHIWFIANIYTAYVLGKFGPKIQNCQFKLKFGTVGYSNLKDSVVQLTFSVFDWKYLFGQIWSKKSNSSV